MRIFLCWASGALTGAGIVWLLFIPSSKPIWLALLMFVYVGSGFYAVYLSGLTLSDKHTEPRSFSDIKDSIRRRA